MRGHVRALIAVALAAGLLALFLYNVDLRGVASAIAGAHPMWLGLALLSMFVNLTVRAIRWQYLLSPLGHTSFANSFRATAVGFGSRSILPAAASEFIRPYFLSRHEPISATGAFATVVLERVLDLLTMLMMLASFLFVFGGDLSRADPVLVAIVKGTGAFFAAAALFVLAVLFVVAGHPERVKAVLARVELAVPSRFAGLLGRIADKFLVGLGAVRRPGQLLIALLWSIPLWLLIAFGVWAVAVAFDLAVPFTGSFLIIAFLTIGITVPTPGAVGGFHESFRVAVTHFFGANDNAAVGAAIVAHVLSMGPAFVLALIFAAQAGLNLTGMRQLASQDANAGRIAP
jgi:uncharacterized protein (TIRG00374 family)